MAIRKRCIYCGAPVSTNGYCTECRLPDKFLRKARNTSGYHYNIALEKAKMRDLYGAIESLKVSLRYNKKNIDARNLLGLIYYEVGEMVKALKHWVMSVNYQAKDNPAVHYLKEVRDDKKALEEANDLARMYNLALGYAADRSFDLAVIQLKKCISLNKHFVKGYLLLGLIENEQGRTGRAKKTIRRVLAIDKNNPRALHFLREMGESEGDIVRDIDAAREEETLEDDYYGMESVTADGKRPARKIEVPDRRVKSDSLLNRKYRTISRARMSNIYVLVGILIGVGVLYLMMIPVRDKKNKTEMAKVEASYSERLASKNSETDNLLNEKEALNKTIEDLKKTEEELNNKINSLEEKNSKLQKVINDNNISSPDLGNATSQDASKKGDNDKKDEKGTNGISDTDINNMIDNE